MFGPRYMVTTKTNVRILLRPYRKDEMERVAKLFSNPLVSKWTGSVSGLAMEDEQEWYEKTRTAKDSYHWCIAVLTDEHSVEGLCIGVTGLHGLFNPQHAASSGIIIYDTDWWGKGIASATHIARTSFAAKTLNVAVIKSTVFVENEASRRALESVGYAVTGKDYREYFRDDEYHDLYRLKWFNPKYVPILYPDNSMPEELLPAIERAKKTLEIAKTFVTPL